MKTLPKLFAAACLLSLATACAPSSDALCDHIIEVTKKEGGEEAAKMIDKAECVKSADRRKEMQGLIKYNKKAKCAMSAETLADIDACGKKSE